MRVLMLSPHLYFQGRPGVGMPAVHRTVSGWARAGHEVGLLLLDGDGVAPAPGVRVQPFRVRGRRWGSDLGERFDGVPGLEYLAPLACRLSWLRRYTRAALAAARGACRDGACQDRGAGWDLVYGHTWWSGPAAALLGRELGVPSVLRVYGAQEMGGREGESRLGLKFLDRRLALGAGPRGMGVLSTPPVDRVVVTHDGSFSDALASDLGLDADRIVRWFNGVVRTEGRDARRRERARLRWNLEGPVLLSLSRLTAIKRVDLVLRALAGLRTPAGLGVRLLAAGEGSAEPGLRALARGLGLEDRVVFPGMLDPEGVRDALAASDLLVSAYRTANFSNHTWEAMESGLPALCLHRGEGAEFLEDGRTGWLLREPEDAVVLPWLLAERIDAILADPQALQAAGAAARAWVWRTLPSWEERIRREAELAASLVDRGNRGHDPEFAGRIRVTSPRKAG